MKLNLEQIVEAIEGEAGQLMRGEIGPITFRENVLRLISLNTITNVGEAIEVAGRLSDMAEGENDGTQ